MAMSRQQVSTKVQEVLVEALGVDEDEIKEEATLMGDLGAESIDLLDVAFRLEKVFAIKIPRGELFPEDLLANPDYVDESKRLTDKGIAKLKETMPHADFSEFEQHPEVDRVGDLLTVRMIVNYVESKLGSGSAAPA